ncbi:hypothetical protein [Rhodococcus sp. NPDC059234]|uniref:hypothetical protein n=1 Tax=Rhodococcus sp. NPDC059234 TaxID=3346781 RepID=UPI0036700960
MFESVTELYRAYNSTLVDPAGAGRPGLHAPEWEERLLREQPTVRETREWCPTEPGEVEASLWMTSAVFLSRIVRELGHARADHGGSAVADRVTALCIDSVLAGYDGDLSAAETLVDRAGHAAARNGDLSLAALVAEAAAYMAVFDDDLRGAVYCFEDSLASCRAGGGEEQISTLLGLAAAYALIGDERRCSDCRAEALAIAGTRGDTVRRAG